MDNPISAPEAGAKNTSLRQKGTSMNLTQLRAIVYIDIYKSLSKSAARLFISQASLSIAIKKLEDELGCEIIKRSSQGVQLTEKGKEILKHAQIICAEIDTIMDMGKKGKKQNINISMGVSSYLCNMIASRAMLEINTSIPELNIKINDIHTNANNILEVSSGKFDIALLQFGRIGENRLMPASAEIHNAEIHYLGSDCINVAVPNTHPLAGRSSCTLEELIKYPYVTNKDIEEDAFYLFLKEKGYDKRIFQVNHILNHNVTANINGFWIGASTGMSKMLANIRSSIQLLTIENCQFYYDVMYICKNPDFSAPMTEFIETIKREAKILIKN